MIKARGGLLSHARSARASLLRQLAKQQPPFSAHARKYSRSLSLFSISSVSRGFQGFLSVCDRENPISRSSHDGSILALWSFATRNPSFLSRVSTHKGLHTSSTKGKLTTSELIKSLQLGSTGSKTATSIKAITIDDGAVETRTSQLPLPTVRPKLNKERNDRAIDNGFDKKLDKGCVETVIDNGIDKKPLSKLIPHHVVTRGISKKETFSESQGLPRWKARRDGIEVPQENECKGLAQQHKIPVLQLSKTLKDASFESPRLKGQRQVSAGRRTSEARSDKGFERSDGLLGVGFRNVSPSTKSFPQQGKNREVVAQNHWEISVSARESSEHVDGVCLPNRNMGAQHQSEVENTVKGKLLEGQSKQPQDSMKSPTASSGRMGNSAGFAGKSTPGMIPVLGTEADDSQSVSLNRNTESQHQPNGEPCEERGVTLPLHQESTKSPGEHCGRQPFYMKVASNMPCQRQNNYSKYGGMQPFEATDTHFQLRTKNRESSDRSPFDRRALESNFPPIEENTAVVGRRPFAKNKPRKKVKNELNEKDMSVRPIAGEPHYEYLIRRKRARAEAQNAVRDDVDDYENVGEDWVKSRLAWLCKEAPVLKAGGLVKMLNKQRQWIKQEHLVELVEHLVKQEELNRAHRALKWMQQQPFYEFKYELHNNMLCVLGRNNKVSRAQDVFDEIVRNGKFPDASAFTALINAYLYKGDQGDINDAWKLYNQMLQLGLAVSSSLSETLLKSLSCPTGRWIRQAAELLTKMKATGLYINEEMYTRMIELHGKRGDHKKVDTIIDEMRHEHVDIDVNILNARLAACVKDADMKKAEITFTEMIELGMKPSWHSYAYLIQIYGKNQLPKQAWEIFEKMKAENIPVNFVTYHAIIEVMAADGLHVEQVLQVLREVEERGVKPLQPCYNSVMSMFLKLKRHEDVESIFNKGKAKARPVHAAYNMLLKSYTDSGQLDKAEALFQEMKKTEGLGPNARTYNIMLDGYGVGCFKSKAREIFEDMMAKGCQIDPDVKTRIQSMIGVKKIVELEKKKLKLTDEQREIIPGLLLGGAQMPSPDRDRTYELHLEFNCENHIKRVVKDHLAFLFQAWWKQNKAPASTEGGETPVESSGTKVITRLETLNHGSLRFYAHQYRPKGDPVIPKLIHRWLKPRTLAYWYMYGGYKCQTTGGIVLNASKYSGKQIQLVMKALKARTMDCRRKKKRNGDVIRFEGKSAVWLWKLMEPYILNAVKEQLKPEEVPVNLAFVKGGCAGWDSHNGASSDEDDWDDLEAEMTEC